MAKDNATQSELFSQSVSTKAHPSRRFTTEEETEISQAHLDGRTMTSLAKDWECDFQTISRIIARSGVREFLTPDILPFPQQDREAFGHWLSGFTDGEGHFGLNPRKKYSTPVACFDIVLRADDREILERIRSFFGCGCLYRRESASRDNPAVRYMVSNSAHLVDFIIPHFDKYPLRAKKRRDFIVWKQAVLIIRRVCERSWSPSGHRRKWLPDEEETFMKLRASLQENRRYRSGT